MKNKDVIYVDIEDEITSIIDKVNTSKSKLVALVLPKRDTVFQSIVNMKLLKRSAERAKKNIVLITSDEAILPLAGAVKLHVAKTLQSSPDIPEAPNTDEAPIKIKEKPSDDEKVDVNKSIGELASAAITGSGVGEAEDEAIEVGDSKTGELKEGIAKKIKDTKYKLAGDKKLKIPNFEKFRLLLVIGVVVLILLIVGWVWAAKALPKATITIKTNTQPYNADLTVTFDSTAKTLDPNGMVVPAKIATISKTSTSTSVNTTGQKTVGSPATGTITVTNHNFSTNSVTVPAGTVFTDSSGNFSFTSNSSAVVPGFTVNKGHTNDGVVTIPVTASQVGSSYNIQATAYTSSDSDLTGYDMQGSAMAGGSSNQVQVVAAQDLTNAQNAITAPNANNVQQQLEQTLTAQGLDPISATFTSATPTYTPSAQAGTQANTVTVTESITFTMYGVQKSYLQTLVDNSINTQINPAKQSILDDGISTASYDVQSTTATSEVLVMNDTATVGAKINVAQLKPQVVGKKSGDIQSLIQSDPGVTNVSVHYSPFWVSSTPNNPNKVKIIIEKANGSSL